MNATLRRLYGQRDMDKVASDNTSEGEVDLTQVSAADFLAALSESEEGGEGELDLSQMSAEDLLALAQQADAQEEDPTLAKMASSGELEYWDRAGRILAHSYHDEMHKIAAENSGEIAVADLTAQQLVDLMESGEYDLVDGEPSEAEKVAGRARQAASNWMQAGRYAAGKGADAIKGNPKKALAGGAVAGAAGVGGAIAARKLLKKKDKKD